MHTQNEENDEEDERGREEEDAGTDSTFGAKWGWIACVDKVSETKRVSWDDVFLMSVTEFLNILAYSQDKYNHQENEIKKFKQKH